jgi:hypothetical protein
MKEIAHLGASPALRFLLAISASHHRLSRPQRNGRRRQTCNRCPDPWGTSRGLGLDILIQSKLPNETALLGFFQRLCEDI